MRRMKAEAAIGDDGIGRGFRHQTRRERFLLAQSARETDKIREEIPVMCKARPALQWRVIGRRHEGDPLLISQFPTQGSQSIAMTHNRQCRTFRKQPSDQRQGTLHMPKAHGADRKKNPDRPFARAMRLIGVSQTCPTCSGKAHRCDQGVTCQSLRYSASCRRKRSNQASPGS